MANLQTQWNSLSTQPDGPAKQQEQLRIGNEMKRIRGMHDQMINFLRNQTQAKQQQPQPQPSQHDGSTQPQPHQPTQSHGLAQNKGSPAVQAARPSQPGEGPTTENMMQSGQYQQGLSGGRNSQNPGMPYVSENPQHQAQLAVLQAFAQQQQQKQRQGGGGPAPATSTVNAGMPPAAQSQTPQQQFGLPGSQPQATAGGPVPNHPGSNPQNLQQKQPQQSQVPPLPPGFGNSAQFLNMIISFMSQRQMPFPPGTPFTFVGPMAGSSSGETRSIELNTLFAAVAGLGGSNRLSSAASAGPATTQFASSQGLTGWMILANRLGMAVANPDPNGEGRRDQTPNPAQTPERLRNFYRERLGLFEEWWTNKSRQQQQQRQSHGQPRTQQPQPQPLQQLLPQDLQQTLRLSGGNGVNGIPQQVPQSLAQAQIPGQSPQTPAPPPLPQQQQQQQQSQVLQQSGQSAQTLLPPQQQALQQLALHLQRLVQEGKMTNEEARNRFGQAQASFRAQAAGASQYSVTPILAGVPPDFATAVPATSTASISDPLQVPTSASTGIAPSPGPDPSADAKGAKKRPRKSGGSTAPRSSAANKGATTAPASKITSLDKDLVSGADTKPPSWQGSVPGQNQQPPHNGLPADVTSASASVAQLPLTPRAAMRMLQQGNLTPAQQAAALTAVRANSGSGNDKTAHGHVESASSQRQPRPQPQHALNKFKVEYIPARRDVATHGGWDLALVEAELGPLTKGYGKQPRTVRELGSVDIAALTLSLRSRLEVEVTYALNCLLILSSGSGIRPDMFHVSLSHCGDLLDELVELLESSSFKSHNTKGAVVTQAINLATEPGNGKLPEPSGHDFKLRGQATHSDWVAETLLEEENAWMWRRRHSKRSRSEPSAFDRNDEDPEEVSSEDGTMTRVDDGEPYRRALRTERRLDRQVDIALTIFDILRNFASMAENVVVLAKDKPLLNILGRLVSPEARPETYFSASELLRIRKDVLFIVTAVTGPALKLDELPTATTSSLFDLFCAFILDASGIEGLAGLTYEYPQPPPGIPAHLALRQAPVPSAPRVPHYADMALDGFARFAQPDTNRLVLSHCVPESTLLHLAHTLVKMLPCSDLDFNLFRTEARLSYTEHIAMCLYDIVFLAPSPTKLKLRNTAGWVSAIFRVVKRTSKQHSRQQQQGNGGAAGTSDFIQNPFSCLIYRLVETLKLVDDSLDMFDRNPLLGSGGGDGGSRAYGESSRIKDSGRSSARAPLLAVDETDVLSLLSTPGLDPVLIGHLSSMVAA